MNELRVFESFAGIGTQRLALRKLKIPHKIVAISEIDKDAIVSYDAIHSEKQDVDTPSFKEMYDYLESKNIGYDFKKQKVVLPKSEKALRKIYVAHIRSKNLGDISRVKVEEVPDHDLFTYSFPCTDVSASGKQQAGLAEGSGTRSSLLWECKKVIEGKKPKYLLMENVDNLVKSKFKPYFDVWCEYLKEQGYSNYWEILDSQDYDVAQRRKRVFLVSILGDEKFEFPQPKKDTLSIKDFLDNIVEDKFYQSKLTVLNQDYSHGNQVKVGYKDRLLDATCKKNYIQWDVSGKGYNSQVDRAFYIDGVIGTIPASRTEDKVKILLEDGRVRKPTPLECWRLTGISDQDYYKAKSTGVSQSSLYKQAGNAIVVNVLEGIFREMFLAAEIGGVKGYYTYDNDLELNSIEKGV